MKRYIGIDVGGTTIKFGIFCENGELETTWQIRTDTSQGGKHIIPDIAKSVKEKIQSSGTLTDWRGGIGMGIPGPVNGEGYVEKCVNLNWNQFSPARELEKLLCIPVKVGNDANVAALGEQWQGAGKHFQNVVLFTLGTGVGGGVIINGKIVNGLGGIAGEIGHIRINQEETRNCNCGNRGCLDQMASATGIVRNALLLLRKSDRNSVLRNEEQLTAQMIADAAKEGDRIALDTLEYCLGFLGKAMAIVTHVVAPDAFIVGGGVSAMGDLLLNIVKREYSKNLFLPDPSDYAPIYLASLGGKAGIYGAARMAMQTDS